jgi:hypothetical protein
MQLNKFKKAVAMVTAFLLRNMPLELGYYSVITRYHLQLTF